MNPICTTAILAILGTGLAFVAGVLGGIFGAILLIMAAVFIVVAGLVLGSEAYAQGVEEANIEDVYE